jgi:hypothetical protein
MKTSRVPDLSVILPTDSFETIQPVLEKLRQQTLAPRIELIVVATLIEAVAETLQFERDFAAVRIVQAKAISPLAIPRAAGIRAATAPLIFVGETHSFLRPDAAEKLVAIMADETWAAAVPGFENANPNSLLSWSAFLFAYGRWSANLPAGEIAEAPMYDCVYRRSVLLEWDGRLEEIFLQGDDLRRAMEARGHRVCFEPAARIEHLNIEVPGAWLSELYLIGALVGSKRARRWPWWRRLVYAAGAGLIPAILLRRAWSGLRETARVERLPRGTLALVVVAFVTKAVGEFVGYLGGGGTRAQHMMTRYEVRRIDYVNHSR